MNLLLCRVYATNNMVYVVDEENHRVQILNLDFTYNDSFGRGVGSRGGRAAAAP